MNLIKGMIKGVVIKVVLILIAIVVIYVVCDMMVSAGAVAQEYSSLDSTTWVPNKQYFRESFQQAIKTKSQSSSKVYEFSDSVNIDTSLFTEEQIRLNMEIYEETARVLNELKSKVEPVTDKQLLNEFLQMVNPIMMISIASAETNMYMNTKYTWSSAIYTSVLKPEEMSLDNMRFQYFYESGYRDCLRCKDNCYSFEGGDGAAKHKALWHDQLGLGPVTGKGNDNDSLGPSQILRRYLGVKGSAGSYYAGKIDYGNFGVVEDLMCWEDNCEWMFYNWYSNIILNTENTLNSNEYSLVAALAIAHNTGPAFLNSSAITAGNAWNAYSEVKRNRENVFSYIEKITSEEMLQYYQKEVVLPWYEDVKEKQARGESWGYPGNKFADDQRAALMPEIFDKIGVTDVWSVVNKYYTNDAGAQCMYSSEEAMWSSFRGIKIAYPIKAVINYMALKMLYQSGEYSGI